MFSNCGNFSANANQADFRMTDGEPLVHGLFDKKNDLFSGTNTGPCIYLTGLVML